jgi:saccharopine dehydrogenase-like NADP-dependent oxidoreductase
MRFLMYELILKEDKKQLEAILSNAKPPVKEDVVYVYAVVEGWKGDQILRDEYFNAFYPKKIAWRTWRAISWTTAAAVAAVVEMVADGTLAQNGFIKQEEIDIDAFYKTQNGSLLKT